MRIQILALSVMSALAMGCSNQWREGDAEVTAEQMLSYLGEVSSAQTTSTSGGDLAGALALKDQEGVRIYFAESSGINSPMGPVASVLSLGNFEFMGMPELTWNQIEQTRVFFLDVPTADGGHTSGLIVGIRKAGETALTYAGFTGSGAMNEEDFVVTLQANGADKMVLRTFDVDGGDLTSVIQMLIWDIDPSGAEYYNGKFSTLIGFGD